MEFARFPTLDHPSEQKSRAGDTDAAKTKTWRGWGTHMDSARLPWFPALAGGLAARHSTAGDSLRRVGAVSSPGVDPATGGLAGSFGCRARCGEEPGPGAQRRDG